MPRLDNGPVCVVVCMRDLETSLPPLMCVLMTFLSGALTPLYINHCKSRWSSFCQEILSKKLSKDKFDIEKSIHMVLKLFLLIQ